MHVQPGRLDDCQACLTYHVDHVTDNESNLYHINVHCLPSSHIIALLHNCLEHFDIKSLLSSSSVSSETTSQQHPLLLEQEEIYLMCHQHQYGHHARLSYLQDQTSPNARPSVLLWEQIKDKHDKEWILDILIKSTSAYRNLQVLHTYEWRTQVFIPQGIRRH